MKLTWAHQVKAVIHTSTHGLECSILSGGIGSQWGKIDSWSRGIASTLFNEDGKAGSTPLDLKQMHSKIKYKMRFAAKFM